MIYEDDETNPDAAERAVLKLIERDGVLAIVGPITSRNLNAIKPIVERLRDHHSTMNLFLAKTTARDLVTVRALGAIAPVSGCR